MAGSGVADDRAYADLVAQRLAEGDGHGAYGWCKGWIGSGGGAGLVDPWLGYVASGLLDGQPRTAVHAIDLALRNWVPRAGDRSILHWARARVIRIHLEDPKTALVDLAAAATSAPAWLCPTVVDDAVRCEAEAARSRKRKASVGPAPAFAPPSDVAGAAAARRAKLPPDGTEPFLWEALQPTLEAPAGT